MNGDEDEKRVTLKPPKYIELSMDESIRLIICVILDIAEYVAPILLTPIIGDALDIFGFGASIIMFRWLGLLSLLEFIPLADIFPIFIITWLIWYYMRKEEEKERMRKMKEQWK